MSTVGANDPALNSEGSWFEWVALAGAGFTAGILMGWLWHQCRFGFDFTDEGSHLVWIARPAHYPASVSQFGFIYHPLYRLVGGDIVLLRRVNLLLTLGLSWMLCWTLFIKTAAAAAPRRWPYAITAAILSVGVLAFLDPWLPTPNYYSLALQALLLAGTGLLLAEATLSRNSIAGWSLIGVAGWLAFMAKPTTAAGLAAVIAGGQLLAGRLRLRPLLVAVMTTLLLLLLSAWLIDGSIAGFISRLVEGAADARQLKAGYTWREILRLDDFSLERREKITLAANAALILLATGLALLRPAVARGISALLVLFFSLLGTLTLLGIFHPAIPPSRFQGLQFLAAPLGTLTAVLLLAIRKSIALANLETWALAACFALFPYLYVFGTNDNYWATAPAAAIFWVLAGVLALGRLHPQRMAWPQFLPVAVAVMCGTIVLLGLGIQRPYRQIPPLGAGRETIRVMPTAAELMVSTPFADYVRRLQAAARDAGFKPGDPMIDLTGRYPGALYLLGAKSVGLPWLIGGYAGSRNLAGRALHRASPAELRQAWILAEPTGPRSLPADLLKSHGLDLGRDYVEIATMDAPRGGEVTESFPQYLLRPRDIRSP